MKKLPIAHTEIKTIIEGNFCYVDKTMFVKQLLDDGHRYYFLSRPRRFGKSLFLDTIRAAFEAEQELFKGLYLEKNWDWSVKYPVISISLGSTGADTKEKLELRINQILENNSKKYAIELTRTNSTGAFEELVQKLKEKYNLPVIILIDEYDNPILNNLTKPSAEEIRETLSDFYSVLKDASQYIKLVFLTGVSKFSKTSIFSKLNNITDISLNPAYADICGYTQHDLETIFADYLKGVDLEKVKLWYNGYNFLGKNVYNPYDVLMFFWEKEYKPYWFETGTPKFLIDLIKKRHFYIPDLEKVRVSQAQMGEFDIHNIEIDVLLLQTGYLTIKTKRQIGDNFFYDLKIPNKEVRMGLNNYLLRMFYAAGVNSYERSALSEKIYFALFDQKPQDLEEAFRVFFSGIPHQWYIKNDIAKFEGFYSSLFYAVFASLGVEMEVEASTNKGRIDLIVKTEEAVFIFEFKMKTNPKNAIEQIKEMKYADKYLADNKNIYLVGIEFDESQKNLSQFEFEKI